jgi:hypothetical protein
MDDTLIKSQLTALASEAKNSVPNINKGGCAIFASIVAKHLSNHGITPFVVLGEYYDHENLDLDIAQVANVAGSDISKWGQHEVTFAHVALDLKIGKQNYFYDSNGLLDGNSEVLSGCFLVRNGRLGVPLISSMARNKTIWCDTFNRRDVPKLKKLATKYLGV